MTHRLMELTGMLRNSAASRAITYPRSSASADGPPLTRIASAGIGCIPRSMGSCRPLFHLFPGDCQPFHDVACQAGRVRIQLAQQPEADELLGRNPLALLIG